MASIYSERLHFMHKTIRVMTVLPGPWNSPIECRLKQLCLSRTTKYDTVSYTWGDLDNTTPILIESSEIRISSNLEGFLRHVRRPFDSIELWADAICINQQDLEEKAQQVKMMGEIFRRSSSTYIWLGVPNAVDTGASSTKTYRKCFS
jgi:hypothetical protein